MKRALPKRIISSVLAMTMSMALTSGLFQVAAAEEYTFQILFTSDLHGSFSDWSYSTNGNFTGLARAASKINEFREAAGAENTVLIDMGDAIQGNGTSVFHTENWDGSDLNTGLYPTYAGLEYLDYDYSVLGNHEFNFGVDRLEKAFGKDSENPFSGSILAGNVFDTEGNAAFDAYYIKEFPNGLRVAFVGMTHPNIVNWDAGNLAGVYTTKSASEVTAETIAYLKSEESVALNGAIDLFVATQHMSDTRETEEGSGAVDVIGVNGEDLSLFIGAHGHQNQDKMVDGVRYVEISSNGGRMGKVDVTVTNDGEGWAVADKEGDVVMTNVTLSQYDDNENFTAADAGYMEALAGYDTFAKDYSNEVIGELTGGPLVPVPEIKGTYEGYLQDTALVHLINEAMIYYTNNAVQEDPELAAKGMEVTLSGTAPLDTNANAQPGPLSRGNVSSIYKYDNNTLYVVEMTGEQFKAWMEWAYVFIGPFEGTGYEGFNLGPAMVDGDLTIPYGNGNMPGYNMDQFSGLNYKVDLTKNYGERIVEMTNPDGTPFDLEKTYWVAVNNYRADTQLLINAVETDRPAVFPEGKSEPAVAIARNVDTNLYVDGVAKENGEGMLGVMIDYIDRVKGGAISNEFTPNWEYILPEADEELRALAIQYVEDGTIDLSVNNGYSRRAATEEEVTALRDAAPASEEEVVEETTEETIEEVTAEEVSDDTLTRAEAVQTIYETAGSPAVEGPAFTDVSEENAAAVSWAVASGIISGNGDDTFSPDQPLTNEAAYSIIYYGAKFAGLVDGETSDLADFSDADQVQDWALTAVQWSAANGFVEGETLDPQGTVTADELNGFISAFVEFVAQ